MNIFISNIISSMGDISIGGITSDKRGNVYFVEDPYQLIRKITPYSPSTHSAAVSVTNRSKNVTLYPDPTEHYLTVQFEGNGVL